MAGTQRNWRAEEDAALSRIAGQVCRPGSGRHWLSGRTAGEGRKASDRRAVVAAAAARGEVRTFTVR